MEYLLTCSCGKQHTVSKSQAGQEIECGCGEIIRIPTLRGLTQLPSATPETDEPAKKRGSWKGWRAPAMALCSAGILIAGVAGLRFFLQSYLTDTSVTEEIAVETGDALLDLYDADDLSVVWNQYSEQGMGPKRRPTFYLLAKYARERMVLAQIAGGVTLAFGVAAAAIWLSARRKGD